MPFSSSTSMPCMVWRYAAYQRMYCAASGNCDAHASAARALSVRTRFRASGIGAPMRIRSRPAASTITSPLARSTGITLAFIQPGKPNQNAYIERFNRSYRTEILNTWVVTTLDEVRELSDAWRRRYNTEPTHDSLGAVPPLTFLPSATSTDLSYNAWPA